MPPVSTQSSSTPASTAPPPTTPSNASGPLGPDGFDESSQQSTLSQSSDRSDSGRQTPKQNTPGGGPPGSHPGGHPGGQQQQPGPHNFMGNFNHPPGSPHSSAPSPGGSMGSGPENPGYPRDGMASPSWQRPPASPVSTPQVRVNICMIFWKYFFMVLYLFDVFSHIVSYFGCTKKISRNSLDVHLSFAINCLQMNNFGGGQQAVTAALSNNSGTPASTKAASKVPNFFSKKTKKQPAKNCCLN